MTLFHHIELTTYPRDIIKIFSLPKKLSLEENIKNMKEIKLIQNYNKQ